MCFKVEGYEAEAMVRITTTRTDEDLARLLKALMKMDLGICQFREVVQDLEDAFLSVTGTGRKGAHGLEKASGPITNYAKTNAE